MNFKDPLLVLGGMVVGSVISWFVTKKICDKNKEEEIEARVEERVASVKETYGRITQEIKDRSEANKNKPDLEKYVNALMKDKHKREPEPEPQPEDEEDLMPPVTDIPVLVSFGEFATALNGYEKITLTLYSDNVCADEEYNVIVLSDYIGEDLASQFMADEDVDEICVRNDPRKIYINVAKDLKTFQEDSGS